MVPSYFLSASSLFSFTFFFTDPATTEIYTLSLHDALPISRPVSRSAVRTSPVPRTRTGLAPARVSRRAPSETSARSEEHTSELQSRENLVCRLLLEKKKKYGVRAMQFP